MANRTNRGRVRGPIQGDPNGIMDIPIIEQHAAEDRPRDLPPMPPGRFKPIDDLVALHVDKALDQTEGGIIIPEWVADKFTAPTGVVVGVGPNCKFVKEGDHVIAPGGLRGVLIQFMGEQVFVTPEVNLCGVIDNTNPEYLEYRKVREVAIAKRDKTKRAEEERLNSKSDS